MKVLYILKDGRDPALEKLMNCQKEGNEISLVELGKIKDYDLVIEVIEKNDKVISW